jgi:hypothetical protein
MRLVRGRKLIGFPTLRDERDGTGLPPDKVLEADTDVGTIWVDEGGHILTDVTPPRAKEAP